MPTYEYSCRDCGQHLEVVQSFRDDALTVCGSCSGTLRKVFSPAGIIFKGSGYYTTDTRAEREQARNGSSKSAGSDSSKDEGASDSGGSDTNSGNDAKGSADTKDAKSDSSSESGSKSGAKSGSQSKSADSGSESAA